MAIMLDKVTKIIDGFTTLNNITLTVNQGEIVGVMSTQLKEKAAFLQLITGAFKPSSGMYRISFDQDEKLKEAIQLVTMSTMHNATFTVQEWKAYEYFLHTQQDFICSWNVQAFLHKDKENLTNCEQYQLHIIRALMKKPRILLLDEPMSHLTSLALDELTFMLLMLKRQGMTIIISGSQKQNPPLICERLYVLDKGSMVQCDFTEQIEKLTCERYLKKLLG